MATIDNLTIEISASADGAVNSLNRLNNAIKPLGGNSRNAAGGMGVLKTENEKANSTLHRTSEDAKRAGRGIRGAGKDMEDAGRSAKKGTSGLSSFWGALKRIAFYRFVRSVIREITEAFKEGTTNLYKWSQATGKSDMAKNLDRIATSVNYLKNSLGAMLEPIVRILTPIIDWAIDGIVTIINWINKLFAALSGSSTYTVAKKVAKSWDDATQSVQGTQSAIKRTILGFDEINALQKNSSGGSGIGGSSQDYTDLFETKPLDGWMKDLSEFIAGIKEKFEPVKKFFDDIGDKARNIWDKFFNGGKEFLNDPLGWCDTHIGQPIIHGVKQIFGINSPSTEMQTVGYYITLGLKQGMIDGLGNIDQWLKDNITGPIMDAFNSDWGTKTLTFTVGTNVDANTLYGLFESAWNREARTLTFTIGTNVDADTLYGYFSAAWDKTARTITFTVGTNVDANGLYSLFDMAWNRETRSLQFTIGTEQTANELYTSFDKAWGRETRSLKFTPAVSMTGTELYNLFALGWDRETRTLSFTPSMSKDAGTLYSDFKAAWGTRTLTLTLGTNVTAQELFKMFETAWNGIKDKMFSVPVTLGTTAIFLWTTFKTAWDTAATALTAKVKLEKDGWTDIDTFLGFGGASGGGGQTSGGGAGRYTVKVGLADPTNSDATNFFGRLEEAWKAAVLAVNKGLNVITIPVMNAVGEKLSNIGTKFNQWLFGNTNTPTTNVTLVGNLGAGTGIYSIGNDGKITVTGVNDTPVTINGVPGVGFTGGLSGTNTYTLSGIDDATVEVDTDFDWSGWDAEWKKRSKQERSVEVVSNLVNGWGSNLQKWFNGIVGDVNNKPFVEIISNLTAANSNWTRNSKKRGLVVELQKWFNGITGNGAVNVTGNLKKGDNMKQSTVFDWIGAAGGILKLTIDLVGKAWDALITFLSSLSGGGKKANGGVYQNGSWSSIPQYAGGTTNAHGSLFLAGEAGPELVGHVGGRTEVLNKSQLASAMYSAVRSAMSGIHLDANMYGGFSNDYGAAEDFAEYMRQDHEDMRQQNELLRQQNELLRQLNEKEYGVSTTAINRANSYMNRRAGVTVAPVGAQ